MRPKTEATKETLFPHKKMHFFPGCIKAAHNTVGEYSDLQLHNFLRNSFKDPKL